MTDLPTTFGKYFLTEKLATGGMAEIYLAKIMGPGGFEKQLVIKQIHPKLTGQRHFVDLFVAEAKTLVTLAHGNIVPVYELGVIDDTYFIAMEYIDGPTLYRLTEMMARKGAQMKPAVAAWITAKILEGLDYAHRKGDGVIHRDLSPRNVMLSRDGEVKLVDFGIAVTLGAADDGVDVQSAPTGSFPYMSPEQVRREPLTGQTDLFSVGVLLWEMLVGHRLFARPDPDATLAAVTDGAIARPSSERPDVPARLDEVVMRALERDLGKRWESAADMLAALQRYLYGLDDTPGPRDVEALVARYCPPETRRVPTHAEPPGDTAVEDGTLPAPPGGPRTAVMDRDSALQRAGQPRGKRARTETFATNVHLEKILERATPLFPFQAIREEPTQPAHEPEGPVPRRPTTARLDRAPATATRLDGEPSASMRLARVSDTSEAEPIEERRSLGPPSSRNLMTLAAVGALVLGGLAIYVFLHGRAAVLRPDAAPKYDAPSYMFEPDAPAGVTASDAAPTAVDAELADAAEPDAAPRDAGGRPPPRIDASVVRPDAAAVAAGTAKLVIGANPWGEIVIDGVARGRTPKEIEVPAGKHVVEVIFKGEDPPLKKTFPITVKDGDSLPIQADFTR